MKKLNEAVLRKLIIETIEGDLVTEGRKKKKIKEVTPVGQEQEENPLGQDPGRTDIGMNSKNFDMSDAEAGNMMSQFSDEQIKYAHDALDKAFEFAKSGNPMLKGSSEDMLKQIMKMFKGESSE